MPVALALGEQFQDAQHVRPGAAAGQLAVGERAGAALAEEVVALGVERPAGVEALHVADAVVHLACRVRARAAGSRAAPGSTRTRARRAGADDHRPVRERHRPGSGIENGGSSCSSTCTPCGRSPRCDLSSSAADRPRSCRRTGGAACRAGRAPCGRCASGRCRRASRRARGRGAWAGWLPVPRPGSRRLETRRDMQSILANGRRRARRAGKVTRRRSVRCERQLTPACADVHERVDVRQGAEAPDEARAFQPPVASTARGGRSCPPGRTRG